jgi:hypothetical protein
LASSRLANASRLLPPRSGLERSDFVHWPFCDITRRTRHVGFPRVKRTYRKRRLRSEPDPDRKFHPWEVVADEVIEL